MQIAAWMVDEIKEKGMEVLNFVDQKSKFEFCQEWSETKNALSRRVAPLYWICFSYLKISYKANKLNDFSAATTC